MYTRSVYKFCVFSMILKLCWNGKTNSMQKNERIETIVFWFVLWIMMKIFKNANFNRIHIPFKVCRRIYYKFLTETKTNNFKQLWDLKGEDKRISDYQIPVFTKISWLKSLNPSWSVSLRSVEKVSFFWTAIGWQFYSKLFWLVRKMFHLFSDWSQTCLQREISYLHYNFFICIYANMSSISFEMWREWRH